MFEQRPRIPPLAVGALCALSACDDHEPTPELREETAHEVRSPAEPPAPRPEPAPLAEFIYFAMKYPRELVVETKTSRIGTAVTDEGVFVNTLELKPPSACVVTKLSPVLPTTCHCMVKVELVDTDADGTADSCDESSRLTCLDEDLQLSLAEVWKAPDDCSAAPRRLRAAALRLAQAYKSWGTDTPQNEFETDDALTLEELCERISKTPALSRWRDRSLQATLTALARDVMGSEFGDEEIVKHATGKLSSTHSCAGEGVWQLTIATETGRAIRKGTCLSKHAFNPVADSWTEISEPECEWVSIDTAPSAVAEQQAPASEGKTSWFQRATRRAKAVFR